MFAKFIFLFQIRVRVRVRVRVRRALPIFFWSPTPGTEPTYALLY